MIKEIAYDELQNEIQEGVHLLDVYGTYCGPCRVLASVLEQFSKKYPFFSILKLNSDENPAFVSDYAIRAVPTLFLYEDGELVKRQSGSLNEASLLEWIGDALYD